MEEAAIVVMLKDKESGYLEKELGSYKISENESLIYNIFAVEVDGKIVVYIRITTDKEVEDWEFEAIYDYYDLETISPFVTSIEEDGECFNPTWIVSFDFVNETAFMEAQIDKILKLHKDELLSVYEAIKDKRDEY